MQRSSRVDYDAIAELYDSTPHREKSADPELIAFLAGRRPAASLTLLDIAWVHGDSAALPFASGSLDFVSCQYAFHHFRDKAGMLREAGWRRC